MKSLLFYSYGYNGSLAYNKQWGIYWVEKSTGRIYVTAATMPDTKIVILFAEDEFKTPTHSRRGSVEMLLVCFYRIKPPTR